MGHGTPYIWDSCPIQSDPPSDLGCRSHDRREILPEHRTGCKLQDHEIKFEKMIDFLFLMN